MKELEEEWAKLDPAPPKPTRFTRSQQEKQAQAPPPSEAVGSTSGEIVEEESHAVDVDPYDLLDPVDILSKIPKDFYENMAATKWSTRKEALEQLDKLTSNPKIEGGQYGELMAVLKKAITKDSNVMVVALAGKCVAGLATGLRSKFAPYATSVVSAILEKFKEKKVNVVTSLREAIDAVYTTTNIAAIQEDVTTAISSKNPSVREETIKFLTRVGCKSKPSDLPRQVLKPICASLSKSMDDTSAPVRDAAAEALGTLLKLLGERAMGPFVDQLDKIKLDKVKEFAEKAEVSAAPSRGGSAAPAPAKAQPVKKTETKSAAPSGPTSKSTTSEPSKKPSTAGSKAKPPSSSTDTAKNKPAGKKGSGGKKAAKTDSATSFKDDEVMKEAEMTPEEVDAKAEELIPANIREQLASTNWKERLAGTEALTQFVNDLDPKTLPSQVLIRTMAKKPGWKESNFQVLKNKFNLCAVIATLSASFSKRSAFYAISGLVEKIGDIKLKEQCKETLMVFAENLSLNYVSLKVSGCASGQKNPKVLSESLNWLSDAIKAFGMKIDIKPHVNYIKQSLAHTNPAVRSSAISALGLIFMYTGPSLRMFFESEKATLLQQIDSEFEKVKDEKPPAPTRGVISKSAGAGQGESTTADDAEDDGASSVTNLADLIPRTDISAQIKPEIISELSDKKWQIRGEALQKVSGIVNEAKYITPNIGELPGSLKARLGDSNKNLITATLNIISSLVKAMGPGSVKHVKTMVPAIIATLGDSKPQVRAAAISCLNSWFDEIGLVPLVESEVISGALATDNPNMRAEMFGWLEEKLPTQKKLPAEVNLIVPILYSCLESRSADVRKKAQGALPAFMNLIGWDAMVKQTSKLKPASKSTVMGVLEKNRPQATSKSNSAAVQKQTSQSSSPEKPKTNERTQEKTSTSKKPDEGTKKGKTSSAASKPVTKATSGKATDSEDDGPILVANPNGRDSRMKAEKELKVLKWNFTTPLDDHIQQLKEQMNACVSKTMLENLFHKDFKYHVVALTALSKAITPLDNPALKVETIQSVDLLLKWCTLRFFDTNTTVLIKCLEFLESLFTLLANEEFKLSEYEASSFLPYLIQKIGDPKDAVRKMIRGLLKWILKVYPASKLFNYIADGLKSKNAKTRTECLGEIAYLVSVFGENVCQPSPAKALPAVAAQISDRDNSVRNAALNAIVEVYNLVGETVYKYLGRISEKDQSLLEERIRRAGKTKTTTETVKPTSQPVKKSSESGGAVEKKSLKQGTTPSKANSASAANTVQQYFSLDLDSIEKAPGSTTNEIPSLVANDHVDDLLKEPLPTLPRTAGSTLTSGRKMFSPSSSSASVDYCVSQIASNDIRLAITALKELENHFKVNGPAVWLKHLNQFMIACVLQLRMILSTHLVSDAYQEEDIINLYKCIFNNLFTLLGEPILARAIPKEILKDVIHVMISTLLDENLVSLYEGPQVIRCLNILMLHITEKPNRNHLLGALIKLLQDSVTHYSSASKFLELIMKCIWRITRMRAANVQELNLSQALLDIHLFFEAHPTSTWKNRSDDTPLRTMKTVLHSLIKLKGDKLLDHIDLISNPDQSEIVMYIRVTLKANTAKSHIKKQSSIQDERSSLELTPQSPKSTKIKRSKISQELHDTLGDIFRKIGSNETTKEGLNALYDFKQENKNVDIDPFLKQTSDFFQKYIARSLKTIKAEREQANSENIEIKTTSSTRIDDPSYFRNRLLVLQKKYGDIQVKEDLTKPNEPEKSESEKEPVNIPSSTPVTLGTVDDNLILPTIPKSNSGDNSSAADNPAESSTDLTELRKRLEIIKNKAM
ncbi:cytoskeleton-associated protein 5-like isoform X2 [Dendronephthya gigantea]|nr:cytoskeleton-associated protein 5-like isoform X2 [Dendronephthya gigantea]